MRRSSFNAYRYREDSSLGGSGADYGGLQIQFWTAGNVTNGSVTNDETPNLRWSREIQDDQKIYERNRRTLLREIDQKVLDSYYLPDEDLPQLSSPLEGRQHQDPAGCRRVSFRSVQYPVCNTIHEVPLDRPVGVVGLYNITFRGQGTFRASWLFRPAANPVAFDEQRPGTKSGQHQIVQSRDDDFDDANFILKCFLMEGYVAYKYLTQMRQEAIVMERLASSPRIVNVYGYCGSSILAEHMRGEVTPELVGGTTDHDYTAGGYILQDELDKLQWQDVRPMNNLTLIDKLQYAIEMAESIADLHGFAGGTIIHGDIHPGKASFFCVGILNYGLASHENRCRSFLRPSSVRYANDN
jgi:hypothetical protein